MLRYVMAWAMLGLASPAMGQDAGGYSMYVNQTPDLVATAVGVAYTNLGLPISGTQADGRVLVALNVPVNRQIFHHPEEQFFDCGSSNSSGLRTVGSTDHRLSVLTKVRVVNGRTEITVWTALTKQDVNLPPESADGGMHHTQTQYTPGTDGTTDATDLNRPLGRGDCPSSGRLEKRVAEAIADAAKS